MLLCSRSNPFMFSSLVVLSNSKFYLPLKRLDIKLIEFIGILYAQRLNLKLKI